MLKFSAEILLFLRPLPSLETNRATCRHSHPHWVMLGGPRARSLGTGRSGGRQEKKQDVRSQLSSFFNTSNASWVVNRVERQDIKVLSSQYSRNIIHRKFSNLNKQQNHLGRLLKLAAAPQPHPKFHVKLLLPACTCESESEVAQSRPTLCDPVDCSPPGSSVHGILQARILE